MGRTADRKRCASPNALAGAVGCGDHRDIDRRRYRGLVRTVLYRDVDSKPAVAKSPPVVPTPEKTPTTPSPSAPAPPVETPHPAPTEAPVSPTPTAESITPKSETPLDDDARFLATISRIYNGAPIPDPALAILSAHKICEHLQEGSTTQRQAALDTMGASPGLSFETASILVEAVIDIYCPQFS